MSNNKKEFNPENYNPFDIGYVFEKEIDSNLDLFSQYDSELTANPTVEIEPPKELDWIDSMYQSLKQKEQEQAVSQEYVSPVIENPTSDNLWDLQMAWAEQNMKPQVESLHYEPQETRHVNTKDIIAQYQDTVIVQPVNTLTTSEVNQAIETAKIDEKINQTTAEDKSQNAQNSVIESSLEDTTNNISAQTVTKRISETRQKFNGTKQERINSVVKAYNDRGKKEYVKPIEDIIQEQSDKMRSVHTQELYDANKLDNPERREKMTMLRDKHDVEMKQFHHDSNAKLYSHYNDEKYKNTREQSIGLLKSRSDYFEKHGKASESIKHYSKSKDFKNYEVKPQETKLSINNDRNAKDFAKQNNSIKVTDPQLSVIAMDKAIHDPDMQKKLGFKNYFHNQDVGLGGFQNQRLSPQQERNAGLETNAPTTLKNNLARGLEVNDPVRYMSSWATAEKAMNDEHEKIKNKPYLINDLKNIDEARMKFEKSLFAYNKAEAYQEGKAHFENTNQKWLDMPSGSDTKDLKELKSQMHSDFQNYIATQKGFKISNDITQVEAKMHAKQSEELYSKKFNSPEYTETKKIHSIEREVTQASVENRSLSKDITNELKQLNYTKSYEFRDFNKEQIYEFNGSRGLNVDKTFNPENAKDMKQVQPQQVEQKTQTNNVNLNKGQPKQEIKPDIQSVKSQMAEMRNSTGLKDNAFSQRQEQIKQSQPQKSNQFGSSNQTQQTPKPSVQDMKKSEPSKDSQSFAELQKRKIGNQNIEL